MIAKEVRVHNIPITRELVKSVKCARSRYVEINNEKKKLKVNSGKALKRKVISTEIEEVQRKKQFLQTSINTLIKDADELALKAHTNADFQILGRSNDLRMLANTKKEQFDECVQMEQALILRKDSIVWLEKYFVVLCCYFVMVLIFVWLASVYFSSEIEFLCCYSF